MTPSRPLLRSAAATLALLLASSLPAVAQGGPPPKRGDAENPDWPCVQRKVATLTSSQIWDGPPTEDLVTWSSDAEVLKIVPGLASRRVKIEEATKAIADLAARTPAAERDERMKRLFQGVLSTINDQRRSVMGGIERLQQRQRARSAEIEREGSEIIKLKEKATDDAGRKALADAEERYAWDVRVFQERQQNIPIACEIPVQIEQRAFEIGREIRKAMSK